VNKKYFKTLLWHKGDFIVAFECLLMRVFSTVLS